MKNADAFLTALERRSKLFASSAIATFNANREVCSWLLNPLARWAQAAYGERIFDEAADGYIRYCLGVAQAQARYERVGQFTPEALPAIASGVYDDESYMVPYMWAAILIYAFWPSMIGHLTLFRTEFLRLLPPGAKVLELACGHGVLSLLAAEERPDIHVTGVDISTPAIAIASRLAAVTGHGERVRFRVADALDGSKQEPPTAYQGIVSAMLAEHLSTPQALFSAISTHLSKDGLAFFSAALESAQRDHVFEFHLESEPLKMAEDAGLRALRLVSDASAIRTPSRFLPRATAMILRAR